MTTSAVRFDAQARGWQVAQLVVLGATAAFVVTVALVPMPSIALFWNVVVPLLPLSFLITPIAWRSLCPLATLNVLASRPGRVARAGGEHDASRGALAIALLLLLVPARHLGLNMSGVALATFVVATVIVAIVAGSRHSSRAGFCNRFCPVLPVERLYGQQPLVAMASARCASCVACTPRGCLDVAREKTVPQLLGRARRSSAWLTTPFGLFASAFPGFIMGYFGAPDVALAEAMRVYLPVATWSLASVGVVNVVVRLGRIDARLALPVLAGAAAAAYYFLAAPGIVRALAGAPGATLALRLATLTVVVAWTVRAVWRARVTHDRGANVAGERTLPVVAE